MSLSPWIFYFILLRWQVVNPYPELVAANTKEYMLDYLPNDFEILSNIKPIEYILIIISIGALQGSSYKIDATNPIA
jgi:hypothetical protein